jgi:hypothetical protein
VKKGDLARRRGTDADRYRRCILLLPSPASGCARRMLGHASAKLTLDTYADLFDDDLDAVTLHARHSPEVTRKCAQNVPTEGSTVS